MAQAPNKKLETNDKLLIELYHDNVTEIINDIIKHNLYHSNEELILAYNSLVTARYMFDKLLN